MVLSTCRILAVPAAALLSSPQSCVLACMLLTASLMVPTVACVLQNPPFLYGTHFSCPGYVMYWLVRAAPAHLLRCCTGAGCSALCSLCNARIFAKA